MKKETIKILKKNTRDKLGPIPPQKVEPTKKQYKRKKKHPEKE